MRTTLHLAFCLAFMLLATNASNVSVRHLRRRGRRQQQMNMTKTAFCESSLHDVSCNGEINQLVTDIDDNMTLLRNFTQHDELIVTELYQRTCRLFEAVAKCVIRKITLCPHPGIRSTHPDIQWYMKNPHLTEIMQNCDQADLVQAFSVDMVCIYRHLETTGECMSSEYQQTYAIMRSAAPPPHNDTTHYCRSYITFMICVEERVSHVCGDQAARFLVSLLRYVFPGEFVDTCTHENDDNVSKLASSSLSFPNSRHHDVSSGCCRTGSDDLVTGVVLLLMGLSTIIYAVIYL